MKLPLKGIYEVMKSKGRCFACLKFGYLKSLEPKVECDCFFVWSLFKGDMTQKMLNVLSLCNALIIFLSNFHRESVQRAYLSQLQQKHCADKLLDLDMHISNPKDRKHSV